MERENKYYTVGEHFIRTKKRGPLQEMQELVLSKKKYAWVISMERRIINEMQEKDMPVRIQKTFSLQAKFRMSTTLHQN